MADLQFTPEQQHGKRALTAVGVRVDKSRASKMTVTYVVIIIGIVVAIQSWLQSKKPATAPPTAPAAAAGNDNAGRRLAPNGLPLPEPTRREQYELDDEEIRTVQVRPARQIDLELIQVGEISRSEHNPRVRINHIWHSIGQRVASIKPEYIVVRIETDRIFVRDDMGNIREYYPGKLHGINVDLMEEYRKHFFERHDMEPDPEPLTPEEAANGNR